MPGSGPRGRAGVIARCAVRKAGRVILRLRPIGDKRHCDGLCGCAKDSTAMGWPRDACGHRAGRLARSCTRICTGFTIASQPGGGARWTACKRLLRAFRTVRPPPELGLGPQPDPPRRHQRQAAARGTRDTRDKQETRDIPASPHASRYVVASSIPLATTSLAHTTQSRPRCFATYSARSAAKHSSF